MFDFSFLVAHCSVAFACVNRLIKRQNGCEVSVTLLMLVIISLHFIGHAYIPSETTSH